MKRFDSNQSESNINPQIMNPVQGQSGSKIETESEKDPKPNKMFYQYLKGNISMHGFH